MKQTILVIDDDIELTTRLERYLKDFDFKVEAVTHSEKGLQYLQEKKPKLVILDVMLPDMNGLDVCKQIRKNSQIPIIILSARGEVTDRIIGLELGADDYIKKPFEPRELVTRIQTVLRRSYELSDHPNPCLDFGDLKVDLDSHTVYLNDQLIELTSTEFHLLSLFIKNPGKVASRDYIMESVNGIEWESYNRSVDVLIHKLRHKLNDDPRHPTYLKTVRGTGYIFLGKIK